MPSKLAWTAEAWSDYVYWQGEDRKTLRRINTIIQAALRSPYRGMGKPEALKANLAGFWSRRIDSSNRMVYAVDGEVLTILSCRYHY